MLIQENIGRRIHRDSRKGMIRNKIKNYAYIKMQCNAEEQDKQKNSMQIVSFKNQKIVVPKKPKKNYKNANYNREKFEPRSALTRNKEGEIISKQDEILQRQAENFKERFKHKRQGRF